MKITKRILCIILAVVITAIPFNIISSYAASNLESLKIVRLPDKLKFYKGADWDYGEWVQSVNDDDSFSWKANPNLISFLYHPMSGVLPERGLVDMTGLQIELTYKNGSKKTVTYTETKSGQIYKTNICVSPYKGRQYAIGINTMEVYLPTDYSQSDTYQIELINGPKPARAMGDVDGNGKLNSTDALLILNHSVSISTLTAEQKKYADMNSDGKYNSVDALFILKAAVSKQ